jgi:hypothetical protein
MRRFHLVDFAAHYQKGFRNHIVAIVDIPGLVEAFDHYGCYATYFFFSDEVLTYMSVQCEESVPTIAGYEGKVWAPFLPIDLDHPDLGPALEAARFLSTLFIEVGRSIRAACKSISVGPRAFPYYWILDFSVCLRKNCR